MKVAFVTNLPEDLRSPRGGVQSTAVATVCALAEVPGIELHAVVVNAHVTRDEDRPLGRALLHYRRARRRPVLLGVLTDQRRTVTRLLRAIRPDVVHASDTSYFKVAHRGCPVIYHLQGTIHADTLFGGRGRRLRSLAWKYVERHGLRRADAVLVNNACVAESIAGQRRAGVYVSDEPVNPEFWTVRRTEVPTRVLCVGKVNALKNSAALVRCAGLLKGRGVYAEIRFAGRAAPEYEAMLRALMEEHGVADRCRLLGHLGRDELLAELCSAAVLAHPSLREHAPAAISEAAVIGLPVVASRVGGIPNMVEEGRTGFLIDPHDPGQLADRLERLLCDPELRATMSARARQAAHARFSGEAVARRLLGIYQECLASWAPCPAIGEPVG